MYSSPGAYSCTSRIHRTRHRRRSPCAGGRGTGGSAPGSQHAGGAPLVRRAADRAAPRPRPPTAVSSALVSALVAPADVSRHSITDRHGLTPCCMHIASSQGLRTKAQITSSLLDRSATHCLRWGRRRAEHATERLPLSGFVRRMGILRSLVLRPHLFRLGIEHARCLEV